jgi:hypothetical protein
MSEIMLVPLPRLYQVSKRVQDCYVRGANNSRSAKPEVQNSRLFKAFDQLFNLPYLDVLLGFAAWWSTHDGGFYSVRLSWRRRGLWEDGASLGAPSGRVELREVGRASGTFLGSSFCGEQRLLLLVDQILTTSMCWLRPWCERRQGSAYIARDDRNTRRDRDCHIDMVFAGKCLSHGSKSVHLHSC